MEERNNDKNLEVFIAELMIEDVRLYEGIWAKNLAYAKKLIEDKKPLHEMKTFEIHTVIAYAGLWLMDYQFEDAQTARLYDEMRDTFWQAVERLAQRRINYGMPKKN